jgi:hypothetical protein
VGCGVLGAGYRAAPAGLAHPPLRIAPRSVVPRCLPLVAAIAQWLKSVPGVGVGYALGYQLGPGGGVVVGDGGSAVAVGVVLAVDSNTSRIGCEEGCSGLAPLVAIAAAGCAGRLGAAVVYRAGLQSPTAGLITGAGALDHDYVRLQRRLRYRSASGQLVQRRDGKAIHPVLCRQATHSRDCTPSRVPPVHCSHYTTLSRRSRTTNAIRQRMPMKTRSMVTPLCSVATLPHGVQGVTRAYMRMSCSLASSSSPGSQPVGS